MKTNYDIFISYRRTAYDTANLIAEKLRNAGYRPLSEKERYAYENFHAQFGSNEKKRAFRDNPDDMKFDSFPMLAIPEILRIVNKP